MPKNKKTISPIDGNVYVERARATAADVDATLDRAVRAAGDWRSVPIAQRADYCTRFVDALVANTDKIAVELTHQMGRPIAHAPGEVRGFEERARHMIAIAEQSLADVAVEPIDGFTRFIRREPLGVVFTVAAWNYPYLIAVNSVVPAIMAGNAVVLKHSSQTPLVAERFAQAFSAAELPDGVFQFVHIDHAGTERIVADDRVDFVAFTGSVGGGRQVQRAASERSAAVGLELGGKDPAYVRSDADLDFTISNLVEGAMFNSGQSCCAIERIYAYADVYDAVVEGVVELAGQYRLGNPLDPDTTLGPLVRTAAADFVRAQIDEAVAQGARPLIDHQGFKGDEPGTPYLAPQVLVDVDHSMRVMREETFGPAVGIMRVSDDDEAITLINNSPFGLTASVWTSDVDAAVAIGQRVDTGTWFMNRCDYLDPALAWVGVKDSGRGCTLSSVGYESLTRPKSFHLRTQT